MVKFITGVAELKREVKLLPAIIQVDSETTGLHFIENEMLLLQIGYGNVQLVIDVRAIGAKVVGEACRRIFESVKVLKIFQHALFDLCFIERHMGVAINNVYDTKLAEQVLQGANKVSSSLKDILARYGLRDMDKSTRMQFVNFNQPKFTKQMIKYAADDVRYLEKVRKLQLAAASETDKRIIDLENQVVLVLAKMRYHGICFDEDMWLGIAAENEKKYNVLLRKMPKDVANWGSEKQVKKYFAAKDINIKSYADLPEMQQSVKDKTFQKFIELRSHYQDVKLYGAGWLTTTLIKKAPIQTAHTVHAGRVHTNFNQILETGRIASIQPNLMQLKKTGEHRACFSAAPGKVLVIADYSNQEIATAAALSGEVRWINAIKEGGSIHDTTAAQLFGATYTKQQRELAKRINFAILYGAGAAKIAKNLLIPENMARDLIRRWKRALPILSGFFSNQARMAEVTKESVSMYGRRRSLVNTHNRYTVSQNNPIQSSGADMMKLALVQIDQQFAANPQLGGRAVLSIHDEIICEVDAKQGKVAAKMIKMCMESAAEEVLGMRLITTTPVLSKIWKK